MVQFARVQHVSVPMPPGASEAARSFYRDALGLEEKRPPSSLSAQELIWFRVGDDELHLFGDTAGLGSHSAQHLCLQVDDLEALRRRLEERDVTIEHDVPRITNRPRMFVRDPFGNLIELTQITGTYDEE